MIKIPEALQKRYNLLLIHSEIAPYQYSHCKKWLRFYLDFCHKYNHAYTDKNSLLLFVEKLKEKKQTDFQQSLAKKAVALYYSGIETADVCADDLVSSQETHVQKAIRAAVRKSKFLKRASAIRFVTALQVICFRPIMISGRFRNCWGTLV